MRPLFATSVFLLLAGCDAAESDRYPAELRFPQRADPIVAQTPPAAPAGPTPAGKGDDAIAAFPALGGTLLQPDDVPASERATFDAALADLFGTPAEPKLDGVDPVVLAEGSRLYRRHCAQCHGVGGDGRGPAGAWHNPMPRDFRPGVFKSASGSPTGKPTRDGLRRVLRAGVAGTAMQAFDLLPQQDIDAMAEYVVFLSVRGETELAWLRAALDPDREPIPPTAEALAGVAATVRGRWEQASAPAPLAASGEVRRGFELFHGAGGCASCHVDYGRTPSYRYDVWGAVARVPDLTRGEFRWGKAEADHARKIRHGIPGSGMPGTPLPDADVAALAAFSARLPYPPQLPADVRSRVYP